MKKENEMYIRNEKSHVVSENTKSVAESMKSRKLIQNKGVIL